MREYVLDANDVMRYFGVKSSLGGDKVRELFQLSEKRKANLLMSVVNLGEVHYILLKYIGERAAQEHLQALQHADTMVGVDQASALEAASLKHAYKIGHADSFAAALALRLKATLVSADPIFEKLGMSLKWIKLPPFVPNAEGRPRNR